MSSNQNASTRRGPKVRGTCNAGHVTERYADAGRVTWAGPCAKDGCDLTVRARRVPASRSAAAKDDPTPEPADDNGRSVTVKEVDYAQPQPKRQRQHAPRVVNDEPGDADAGEPAAPVEPAVQRGDDAPEPAGHVEPAAPVVGDTRHAPERRPRRRWAFRSPLDR